MKQQIKTEQPKTNVITAPKATIYLMGDFGMGFTKLEVSELKTCTAPYAQYTNAVHIGYKPKGARKMRGTVQTYKPNAVILEGWGHPDAPAAMEPDPENPNCSRSKHMSHDAGWQTDFDKWIAEYVASSKAKVIADYRNHNSNEAPSFGVGYSSVMTAERTIGTR
jgi:hypothetical protein